MARKKIENLSFEESLDELDTIVQNLEQGDLALEESMALEKLKSAEQQINILLEKNGQSQLSPFNTDETISSD